MKAEDQPYHRYDTPKQPSQVISIFHRGPLMPELIKSSLYLFIFPLRVVLVRVLF